MKKLLTLAAVALVTIGLAGCVVAPPYGYGYAPAYGYAPGYYAGPSVSVGVGYSCCWGHGGWHR
ncbi:hypothetical protein PPMP20_33845 [Paraburkholderia phymatum]|uniref:Lipoprotein n=1 Tax=Paraburkholderia phymatum (strain DSM 17167 / CIP 108236 / LMG 21445 / STM815) TaxID=391038 RepID=B2JMK2_PARP8|nr:hypothetical protein [Paraburkholderia phymatum]ACC72796.1 hypothetical protein Bphy_3661 [Paraburkholderia phymatum STM815]